MEDRGKDMMGRLLVGLVLLAAGGLVVGVPAVWADPFAWEEAEVRMARHALRFGGVVTARVGTIAQGSRLDTTGAAQWRGREPVELLREMTDSQPEMDVSGGRLRVRWMASPVGQRGNRGWCGGGGLMGAWWWRVGVTLG